MAGFNALTTKIVRKRKLEILTLNKAVNQTELPCIPRGGLVDRVRGLARELRDLLLRRKAWELPALAALREDLGKHGERIVETRTPVSTITSDQM